MEMDLLKLASFWIGIISLIAIAIANENAPHICGNEIDRSNDIDDRPIDNDFESENVGRSHHNGGPNQGHDACGKWHLRLEEHTGEKDHGDVCRNSGNNGYQCPKGCAKTPGEKKPFCQMSQSNKSPCRLVCEDGYPRLKTYPDAAKHGNVCRKPNDNNYRCPRGCKKTKNGKAPFCSTFKDAKEPCRNQGCKDALPNKMNINPSCKKLKRTCPDIAQCGCCADSLGNALGYSNNAKKCRSALGRDANKIVKSFCKISCRQCANGGWSEYGSYSSCSAPCGGGTKTRTRTCTAPKPYGGGDYCQGSDTQTKSCNNAACNQPCTSEQMNKGCCDPVINATLAREWEFTDNGAGGSWTVGTDFIQFNIADDQQCGGSANAIQEGQAHIHFFPDSLTTITLQMTGKAESSLETFMFFFNYNPIVTVQASDNDYCEVGTCKMCDVSMAPVELALGWNPCFDVNITTVDQFYHSNAFFRIDFSVKSKQADSTSKQADVCKSCQCPTKPRPTTTTCEPQPPPPGPLTPTKDEYYTQLYSYQYNCSNHPNPKYDDMTCDCQRNGCQEYADVYYSTAVNQTGHQHYDCEGNTWTGASYIDPRPTRYDRYIDYLNGTTSQEIPSHGYYGKLPFTSYAEGPSSDTLRDIADSGYGGRICGFGTTWHPARQQCIRMEDDYTTIDGTGYQNQRPVYPFMRPEGDRRCYDNPDDIYPYLNYNQEYTMATYPHGTDHGCTPQYPNGTCHADRCRFPLTSDHGQQQARLYVSLFREVYEYVGADPDKIIRRARIRTLIDNHSTFTGMHGNGVFLPWHRWYLLELETILMQHQEETIDWWSDDYCNNTFYGIPYFDWHNLPCDVLPKDFINNPVFHNSLGEPTPPISENCVGGALGGLLLTTGSCVTRGWTDGDAEKFPEINLHPLFPLPTNYDQFRQHLESSNLAGLHGPIHCTVGGTMCSYRSPNDPLFFNHHSNVDKIWNDWQTQSNAHLNMYVGATPLNNLMPASTATPADMLDLSNLLYTPPFGGWPGTISVEYVDMDTSSMMGDGNTFSR